jgi:ribosomal protein S18 acetylase RimI-like enzyme
LNPKPIFRVANMADLDALFHLMRQLYADDPGATSLQEAEVLAPLTELLTSPAYGRVYVAMLDNHVVGSMVVCFGFSLEFRGRDAFIDEFVIDREHRSQRIGSELLEFVLSDIAHYQIRALHLEVSKDNQRAADFYHGRGFVDHQRHLSTRWLTEKDLSPQTEEGSKGGEAAWQEDRLESR